MRSTNCRSSSIGALGGLAIALLGMLGCGSVDRVFCPNGNCGWDEQEVSRVADLGELPATPPPDLSNKYVGNPAAEQLGRQFFWDTRFSGASQMTDEIKRPVLFGRAAKGQPLNIACVTCHNLKRGGIDDSVNPGNVSIGAKWTDTNTPTVFNLAFQQLILWAGRTDNIWAQAIGGIEGSVGCNRLRASWTIASFYRAPYESVFTEYPLPMSGAIADLQPTLETTAPLAGQCKLNPDCPSTCRAVKDDASGATGCFPRFPLDGKPGNKMGCQPGDASEPFGDAWDCMDPADQKLVMRVVVNFAKAIGAFEYKLVSRNSDFDKFVGDLRQGHGDDSTAISEDAKQGARLFVGKAGCSDCHNTPLLSDQHFYNVGVPQVGQAVPTIEDCPAGGVCDCVNGVNCLPWGGYDGIQKMRKNAYLRTSMWSDNPADDSRKPYMDGMDAYPKGSFLTPGLRNVALTAPYMHDGIYRTLEEVVDHYNRGGDPNAVGDRNARIKPLYLSDQEKNQLVAFLRTLTGEPLPAELSDPPQLPK